MHRSAPSYESKNAFVVPRNINLIFYNYNNVGHKSYECRRKTFQSSGNPSTSFNKNVRCYNYGHHERECRLYVGHIYPWNKHRSVFGVSRNSLVPSVGYKSIDWRRKSNQFSKNPSTPLSNERIVCYDYNNFGHTAKY